MGSRLLVSSGHFAATLVGFVGWLAPGPAAHAQVIPLEPLDKPVEIVDPKERISGGATMGVALVYLDREATIGAKNLWAYLPREGPDSVRLQISSIDGRYLAETTYKTSGEHGWVPLRLNLRQLEFLDRYEDPKEEVAVLLTDADGARHFPAWWGPAYDAEKVQETLPKLTVEDRLRIYVNTERATGFTVTDEKRPAMCTETSAPSSFKFNAFCDVALGELSLGTAPGEQGNLEVHRRSGMRTIDSIHLTVSVDE